VTTVDKTTPWSNGETIRGFYLFKGKDPVYSIGKDSGKASVAGAYASYTNDVANSHSLSLLGTSGSDVTLELRILNDSPTGKVLCGADVSFLAYQWTFPENGVGKRLMCSWAVTDGASVRPADSAWTVDDAADLMAVTAPPEGQTYRVEARSSSTGRITVPVGGMLWIRWQVANMSGSPMLGIGDVRVRIQLLKLPTVIHFR